MRKLLPLAIALLLVATACLHTPGGVAPSTTPLCGKQYDVIGPVEGTDSLWLLLGFIPISSGNTIQGAIEDALEERGGNALIEVTVNSTYHWYIILSRYITIVRGKAIRVSSGYRR